MLREKIIPVVAALILAVFTLLLLSGGDLSPVSRLFCSSPESLTDIGVYGLNSSDMGQLNSLVTVRVSLAYGNGTGGCELLGENATVIIRKGDGASEEFTVDVGGGAVFERDFRLDSDGLWRVEVRRNPVFLMDCGEYRRAGTESFSFRVFTEGEIKSLMRSSDDSFWQAPLTVGIITTLLAVVLGFFVRRMWRKRQES